MIVGDQIQLSALNRIDAKDVLKWVNDPKIKYLTGTVFPVSDIEHELWYESRILDKSGKMFGIQDIATERLMGIVGLKNIDFINRNAELYIYIGEESYWGKGWGTEATQLIVRFAFDELNLHRVYLGVFSYNARAIKSYEKVGFVREGIMKDSVFKLGKYHDKILMAIINDN